MKHSSEHTKGVIALIFLSLIFASMGLFVRLLEYNFTLLQQMYLRIFVAFVFGILLFSKDFHFHKLRLLSLREWSILLLRAITLYVLGVTLLSQGIILTKYSNAYFVGAIPVTAVLGFILLREKVTFEKVFYILLAFIGATIVGVNDYTHIFLWGRGEVYVLLSSIFVSISWIARKWQSQVLNNKEIAIIIFFISSLLLFCTSLVFGEKLPTIHQFTTITIFAIAGSALFNVINLVLTNYGFQKVEAVLASNLLTLETVFAAILSIIFFREIPTIKELIGGVLIVLSVYQMNKLEG